MSRFLPAVALLLLEIGLASSADYPFWRGPSRNGHVPEDSGWDGNAWRIKETWRTNVGEGCTSPLVVGNRIYTMGWRDGRDQVICLDLSDGKVVWSQSYDGPRYGRHAAGDQSIYSGVSSTPEYDADTGLLFALGTDGDLRCWDTKQQGKLVWHLNLYEKYGVSQRPKVGRSPIRDYGYTSSPLVHQDSLVVEVGAKTGTLMGFDKRNGRELWRSEHAGPAGHNGGPALIRVENTPCVVVLALDGLVVARLDAGKMGKTVATYPWRTEFANNIASASVHENSIILTSNYNINKMARLRLTLAGIEVVWKKDFVSKVCTPIVHQGYVYWAWMKLYCLNFETGELVWDSPGFSDPGSCLVTSDDRLIVYSGQGKLTLADTAARSPKKFQRLAEQKVLSHTNAWPHVVLANGRLLCKDAAGELVCLAIPVK